MNGRVDLNCDLGEGAGQDDALMPLITSANIACGGHAGDPETMRATLRLARKHGVASGAHPGFEDRANFGRRELALTAIQIIDLVQTQVKALRKIAGEENVQLTHVKPHGALYNLSARDPIVADAIAEAVFGVDATLWLYGLAGGELLRAGRARGLRVASEVFADRSYQADGSLTPRTQANALHSTTADSVAQALFMLQEGCVKATDGTAVVISADTLCLHGDGAQAVEFARGVRQALQEAGIEMRPLDARLDC